MTSKSNNHSSWPTTTRDRGLWRGGVGNAYGHQSTNEGGTTIAPSRGSGFRRFREGRWARGWQQGQKRGAWRRGFKVGHESQSRFPENYNGVLVKNLEKKDIGVEKEEEVDGRITECEFAGSYCWVAEERESEKKILVPGAPRLWSLPEEIPRLKEDSGDFSKDINAARSPNHPFEPAIQALFEMNEEFDTDSIDVVTCNKVLNYLLKFADEADQTFGFEVEVVGTTAFFVRREASPREVLQNVRGYGHTFPEAYTVWEEDVKDSVSYQRMITYRLAGRLKCLVRFESDGYLTDEDMPGSLTEKELLQTMKDGGPLQHIPRICRRKGASIPTSATSQLTITGIEKGIRIAKSKNDNSSISRKDVRDSDQELEIERRGRQIPQEVIFEMKTRSFKRGIDMDELCSRLWLCQIPNFVIGYHQAGIFEEPSSEDTDSEGSGFNQKYMEKSRFNGIGIGDMREEVKKWEETNKGQINCLLGIIEDITKAAKNSPEGKVVVTRVGIQQLQIWEAGRTECNTLPEALRKRWEANEADEDKLRCMKCGGFVCNCSDDSDYSDDEAHFSGGESEADYTACSAEDCGYCGHCRY
ncbi:MAG: hypothetical protein M1834_008810 [Cirrosporium novae-zelandiae]|nr:MAG: hypothetical protein M1834_008810 [Cirrosporium novae-zelandiae]